jgi:hypothetical protein
LSSLVLLALWLVGFRSFAAVLVAPLGAGLIGWLVSQLPLRLHVPALDRRDLACLCLLLLLVPAILARPYSRVGEQTAAGKAIRAYFTADVVWAMAVVAEVSKGDMPPQNPYRLQTPLHYYWLAHLLPAIEHRQFHESLPLEKLLLANALLAGLVFVAFLYYFVRHFVENAVAAAIACAFVLLCSSLEGTQQLWTLWVRDRPLDLVRMVNIDSVSRWIFGSLPVDGLHRLLLYQPQHELGYITSASALLVFVESETIGPMISLLAGAMLGASLLISTFSALMMTVTVALYSG